MPRMTEEEAWALDEMVTKNPPRVDPSKARHAVRMAGFEDSGLTEALNAEISAEAEQITA